MTLQIAAPELQGLIISHTTQRDSKVNRLCMAREAEKSVKVQV